MRLIDADALKKLMEEECAEECTICCYANSGDGCRCKLIDNAPTVEPTFGLFREMLCSECEKNCTECKEKRPHGEWIPVSERLPHKNMPCLVSVGKFNLTQIAIYSDLMETIDHKIFYKGDYGKNNFQNITEYVNAWQPLPEPYKEGGAE